MPEPQWPPFVFQMCERFIKLAEGDEQRAVVLLTEHLTSLSGRRADPYLMTAVRRAIADTIRRCR
jgi:hypothetical protein